jgi:hypothetical protein
MRKLLMLLVIVLLSSNVIAQDKLYLVFEFMKVDNEQEVAYEETEAFWEKIHVQRVKNGDITGWDLWSLQPGGEDQGFQYLTVTLYNNPVKMFAGAGGFQAALKAAYPNMTDEKLAKTFNKTGKSRDLAVRIYLEQIDTTKDEFDMPIGTIASLDMMKVDLGNYGKYEKMESEVFKPMHQKDVDAGQKESWGLLRFMSPIGSDTYASHMTVNMFKNYDQFFMQPSNDTPKLTEAQQKAIQDGLKTRDLKYVYMATLIKKAR